MDEMPIRVQMLGGFRISSGDVYLEEIKKKSPKFWRFLQYLITFRSRTISQDELISAIWPDSDERDPGNAMRNMVFRVRSALAESGLPYAKEMILHNGRGYAWNNSLNCIVDIEEFQKLYNQACAAGAAEQTQLELLLQAIELYNGDYIPNAGDELWAMPMVSYYKAIYSKCVYGALKLLMERDEYAQAEMICKKALLIDPYDEKFHEYHLRAMVRQGKQLDAHREYQKMELLFYDDLGVEMSEPLRDIYTDIQRSLNKDRQPLDDLLREWTKPSDYPGAFYCEYGLFKTIYLIEARSIARSGKNVYVVSFDVQHAPGKNDPDIMLKLYDAIQGSLRMGDLFTRAGPNQYLVMLNVRSHENCQMVSDRILKALGGRNRSSRVRSTIRPIKPVQ